jgi:isopentenyl diphosphate isomerase/L-lactate dehydrogenase-like FMN-dependent dehydrogenase
MEEIYAVKEDGQVLFQQVYLTNNDTATEQLFARIKKNGADAIVFTVDSAAGSIRQRAARFGVGSAYVPYFLSRWLDQLG